MKQLKKVVLILMCTGVMMGITACGNNTSDGNTANDNAATEGTTGTNGTTNNTGNTNNTDNNGGIIEDIGDDVQKGINNVEEGVGIEKNTDQNLNGTNNTNNTGTTTNTTDENLNR